MASMVIRLATADDALRNALRAAGHVVVDEGPHDLAIVADKAPEVPPTLMIREPLTAKEGELLAYLLARPGLTVSRDELLEKVWGYAPTSLSRTVDTTIRRLRTKVEPDPYRPVHVLTVHGAGYRFELGEAAPAAPEPPQPLTLTNLGPDTTSFVGREGEIADLAGRLAGGVRLLVLLGPAGAGKTRLSRRVAQRIGGRFAGGAWFCDLTESRSPPDVVAAVASALAIPLSPADPVEQLSHALRARPPLLLVLDNAEQVVKGVASLAAGWLRAAPSLVIVATSRERLRIEGEEVYPVEPLPEDDAVRLFLERARAVPGFVESPEDRPVIAKITERLAGMPLAIELAAARAGVLAPQELLDRLSKALQLLTRGARDATARQATLRGALDWSWDLLTPWERAAYAATSVFRGGWDLEAFEAVVDLSPWPEAPPAVDVLQDLVERSLVRTWRPVELPAIRRFGLYEAMREHAEEKLRAMAGWEAAAKRHRDHVLALAERLADQLPRHGGIDALRRLGLEADNALAVRDRGLQADPEAVVRATLALDPLLYVRGPAQAHADMLETAAARSEHVPPRLRALLLRARGDARRQVGRMADAGADLDAALAIAEASGERQVQAEVKVTRALYLLETGRIGEALQVCVGLRDLAREIGDRRIEGNALAWQGVVEEWSGDVIAAERTLREARAVLREVGDRAREGTVAINIGTAVLAQGREAEAVAMFDEALAICRELGSRRREAIVLVNLASAMLAAGRLDDAERAYRESHRIHVEVGQRREEGVALGNLGWLLLEQGRLDEAERALRDAMALQGEIGNRRSEAICLGNLALVTLARGDRERARRELAETAQRLKALEDRRAASYFLGRLAAFSADAGDVQAARDALAEAESQMGGGDPITLANLALARAHVALASGEGREAAQAVLDEVNGGAASKRSAEIRRAARELKAQLDRAS
jgi:predicted ATPase/Tfp pilus assembly protein PilF